MNTSEATAIKQEDSLTKDQIVDIAQNSTQTTDPLTQTFDNITNPVVKGANESLERGVDGVSKLLGNFSKILNKDITDIGGGILTRNLTDIEYKEKLEDIEATAAVTSMIISNAMPNIIQNIGPDAVDPLIQESVSTLAQSLKDASMLVPGVAAFWLAGDTVRAASILGSAGVNIASAIGQGLIPSGGEYIEVMNMLKSAEAKDRQIQEQNLAQNATLGQNGTLGQNATLGQNGTLDQNGTLGQNATLGQNGTLDQNGTFGQNASLPGPDQIQTGGRKKSNKRQHKHSTKLIAKRVATSIHRFMETNNIQHNKTKKRVPKNKSSKKRPLTRR
jgi:hypothetical protein